MPNNIYQEEEKIIVGFRMRRWVQLLCAKDKKIKNAIKLCQ